MAFVALAIGVFATRDREPGVVERPLLPGGIRDAVAGLAGGRESGSDVVRILRLLVGGEVAGDTFRRQALVDVVDVAGGTRVPGMGSNERPCRMRVSSQLPVGICSVVAGLTRRGERSS